MVKYKWVERQQSTMTEIEIEEDPNEGSDAIAEEVDDRPEAYRRIEEDLLGDTLDLDRELDRFKAMAERNRFTILYLLAAEGELRSGELASLLDRGQNDLYHHLRRLEDAGLVGKYPADDAGRIYELSPLAEQLYQPILDVIRQRANAV